MKKLYYAAVAYAILGLGFGLFFREYTKTHHFTGHTELAVMHTHLLALGMLVMLIAMALEAVLTISNSKWFTAFYWSYNGGLLITVAMMLVIGMRQVNGYASTAMFDGIAGLGHIIITIAFICFFIALGKQVAGYKKA